MRLFRLKKPAPPQKPTLPIGIIYGGRPAEWLHADDDCVTRARKMMRLAGVGDGIGMADRYAETLEIYRRLDREQSAQCTDT